MCGYDISRKVKFANLRRFEFGAKLFEYCECVLRAF